MKVKFERIYGNFKIGDVQNIEDKKELDYILSTETAILLDSNDDFGNDEIDKSEETEDKKKNRKKKNEI